MANNKPETVDIFVICLLTGVLLGGLVAVLTDDWRYSGLITLAGLILGLALRGRFPKSK